MEYTFDISDIENDLHVHSGDQVTLHIPDLADDTVFSLHLSYRSDKRHFIIYDRTAEGIVFTIPAVKQISKKQKRLVFELHNLNPELHDYLAAAWFWWLD